MRAMLVFPECMRVLDFKVKRNYLKLKLRHLKRELEEKEDTDEEEYDDDMSCIDVEVDRERVLECSFEAIHNTSPRVLLTRRLNIVFDEEEGVDAGGLTREWYSILTREIFRADAALFLCAADGITCGFALRNFTSLPDFFAECARALRPGGRFAFLDPARPRFAPFRIGNDIWFHRIVPRIGAALGDAEAYRYLPASTAYLPEPEEMLAMLRRAGFVDLERTTLMLGAVQLITGTRA